MTIFRRTCRSIAAAATAVALSVTMLPTAAAQEELNPQDVQGPQDIDASNVDVDLGGFQDLLENEMLLDYVELCQSGDLSNLPLNDDVEQPEVTAVADCSQSTGDGLAVVLPENVEVGAAAEDVTIDLGDDIKVLGLTYRLGERNLIEILSAAALGSDWIKDLVHKIPYQGSYLPRIDPTKLGAYSTYAEVQRDAALPVNMVTECAGIPTPWGCGGVERTYDKNLSKRTEALKIAEYLTGEKYDYAKPTDLPERPAPRGTSTIIGDGTQVAASMRGGDATAEAHELFGLPGIALAAADEDRSSISYARLGFASAMNMDTDEIGLTWFGGALDFDRLREDGIVDFAGEEVEDMINTVDDLDVPALKEVSCFGLNSYATAEGLGKCSNILGTIDTYQDLRDPEPGEHRQTQVGITDVTSLVLGNDALLKQFTGDAESTPFLDDLMYNVTSEDDRLKFAKDFVRLTSDTYTDEVETPQLDEDGNPVLDENGEPVIETTTRTTTAALLTSDYGFRDPITVEWLGQRVVFFPAAEVNGDERPNYLKLPEIESVAADADAGLLPKVSLVTWDNAFGLGTVALDDLSRPDVIFANWLDSVTLVDDIVWLSGLLGGAGGSSGSSGGDDDAEVPAA
ncbi:hypothetical protein [Corynebacterium glyciniphilum]|uniref:hypothetical protein n=1 Tax=Corynebacterium glyciniphilum TaxID=1404244 RepID=UPI0011AB8A0E|nr:hypothetical protein [Corynebacterium glyciniphilum]